MRNLTDVLTDYLAVRKVGEASAYQLRRTLALFPGKTTTELDDIFVSRWLAELENTHAAWTCSGHRTRLLCIWRFAAKRGLCGPPGEVRRETPPEPMPEVWTLQEMQQLLAACVVSPDGFYFQPLILAGYETGLRRSDLWGLHRSQIAPDGLVTLRQHKTGQPHEPRMRPETAANVLALPGEHPLSSPWPPRDFYRRFKRLRKQAGVSDGALQQLRRTGATEVARQEGIAGASAFLGHRSPQMWRHYVARSAIAKPHMPPRVA
jgi:integrase